MDTTNNKTIANLLREGYVIYKNKSPFLGNFEFHDSCHIYKERLVNIRGYLYFSKVCTRFFPK